DQIVAGIASQRQTTWRQCFFIPIGIQFRKKGVFSSFLRLESRHSLLKSILRDRKRLPESSVYFPRIKMPHLKIAIRAWHPASISDFQEEKPVCLGKGDAVRCFPGRQVRPCQTWFRRVGTEQSLDRLEAVGLTCGVYTC